MISNLTSSLTIGALFFCAFFSGAFALASSLPSSILPTVADALKHEFSSIEEIGTYSMSDDGDGQFDLVVVGAGTKRNQGWRVEVWSVENHRLRKRWDSNSYVTGEEFEMLGLDNIEVHPKEYDYDLVIQGCARHMCADGIHGFLVFSGKTGKTYKVKVVAQGIDKPVEGPQKYDVTYSAGITDEAKRTLQDAMCGTNALSNKQGLPFVCAHK